MKAHKEETAWGLVEVDLDVIAAYAGSIALQCFGIVGMAAVNMRDGIVKLVKREKLTNGIEVHLLENGKLDIVFHVIVAYGVNIATVADNLMHDVKYKIREFCNMDIEKIQVIVEGIRCID